jgi:cytochrome c2
MMRPFLAGLLALVAALTSGSDGPRAQEKEEVAPPAEEVDPGRALFESKCGQCHSLVDGKNGNGPTLFGVLDRPAAAVPGFKYSRAMRQMASQESLTWSEDDLSIFLTRPSALVPGTRMAFPGIRDQEALDALVQWIKANSGPSTSGN